MRNRLIIILAAALATAACAKVSTDNIGGSEEEAPIRFQAVNYLSQTKADTHNHLEFTGESFKVQAFFHDTAFDAAVKKQKTFKYIDDTVVKDADGIWSPKKGPYYWPKTGMLSFFAVYPIINLSYGTEGPTISHYTVEPLYSKQSDATSDLMFATNKDQTCNDESDEHFADGVALVFKHLLTKVMFEGKLLTTKNCVDGKIRVGDVYFTAVIDDIAISGIKNKGGFEFSSDNWILDSGQDLVSSGTIVDMNYSKANGDDFELEKALPATEEFLTFRKGNVPTGDIIGYYVMPQWFGADNTDAKITVKYTVYALKKTSAEGAEEETFKVISRTSYGSEEDTDHPAFEMALKDFYGKKSTESSSYPMNTWKGNTIYNYRFIIDPFEGEIYFDPCMADWDRVDADPVTIHLDVDN